MVQNGLKLQNRLELKVGTKGRKRKTTHGEHKLIIREIKTDPFISSNTIKND